LRLLVCTTWAFSCVSVIDQVPLAVLSDVFPFKDLPLTKMVHEVRSLLATYLGHRDINSTLVYITVTQDLMQEASERFRVVGARCLDQVQEVRT
jgi:hypothetical protein